LDAVVAKKSYNSFSSIFFKLMMTSLGHTLNDPTTISRHVHLLYQEFSKEVKQRFSQLKYKMHIALDGWTSPNIVSFLGIVAVYFHSGQIHRLILEFAPVHEKHTGQNLAKLLHGVCERYEISPRVYSLALDNASNCDTLATHYAKYNDVFKGKAMRIRCFAHIVNLVAGAMMDVFFAKPRLVKAVTASASAIAKPGGRSKKTKAAAASLDVREEEDTEEAPLDALVREGMMEAEADVIGKDPAKRAHDEAVVKAGVREAQIFMRDVHEDCVVLSSDASLAASKLIPKVSGLASFLNKSTSEQSRFEAFCRASKEWQALKTESVKLTLRNATRWNSDLACLVSHQLLEAPIKAYLEHPDTDKALTARFQLTGDQRSMRDDLIDCLGVSGLPHTALAEPGIGLRSSINALSTRRLAAHL
jgi:hypothetical protein